MARFLIIQSVVTPVITSGSAYSTGTALGGQMVFTGFANAGFSRLISAVILDKSNSKAAIDLLLFNQPLATPPGDKNAINITAADLVNLQGRISFASAAYTSLASSANAENTQSNIQLGLIGAVDNNIYGQLVCRGTPTYSSTSDIKVILTGEFIRD